MVVVAATEGGRRLKPILKFPCRALSLNRSAWQPIRCIPELACRCLKSTRANVMPPPGPLPYPLSFASSAVTMATRAALVRIFRLLKFAPPSDSIFFVPTLQLLNFSTSKSATTRPFGGKPFATF